MPILTHLIPIGSERWFSHTNYYKIYHFKYLLFISKNKKLHNFFFLDFFQHFICPLFHLAQMNLQILLNPFQNLNMLKLIPLNWKVVYNQL
jgi:hypothetical protein